MDLCELGTTPIAADNPTGTDARYAPVFDQLQTEVDRLSSPAAAGSPDWERVARLAAQVLESHSKDLLATSYLAVALIHTRGCDGFGLGLKIYRDLIEHFWEELYPQKSRMRGRLRALEWWIEKTEAALEHTGIRAVAADQIALIEHDLNRLEDVLREHLEDAPSLAALKEQLAVLGVAATEEELDQGEAPSAIERAGVGEERAPALQPGIEASAIRPAAMPQPSSPQEPMVALNEGLLRASEAAFRLWQQDLANPLPYRLSRQIAWNAVNELPPAEKRQTRIPPPSSQEKNLLLDLQGNGDPEALLRAAEPRQAQYIFWFDLSRSVAEALDISGNDFRQAREAVCQETALLLHRLPGLEELAFSDGTPFAAPETRSWLKRVALRSSRSDLEAPHVPATSSHEPGAEIVIDKQIRELQELVQKGRLIEAMEAVQQKLRSSSSRRENLLWRLSLSQMLVDLGQSRLALPHLEQVLHDIAGHGLEQYDPSLAMRGFKLAWLAFDSQTEQRFKEQALDVLHQIGRFDMAEMVRLTHP